MEVKGPCVLHPGYVKDKGQGYGQVGRCDLAHRVAWESKHGPLAEGETIDHLCLVKICVNTDHMEVVSQSENIRRAIANGQWDPGAVNREKTACRNGHPFDSANTYIRSDGRRSCRACKSDYRRGVRRRKAVA